MEINLPSEIYGAENVILNPSKNIHVFIGPNGSGKSTLMDKINDYIGNDKVKIIQGNINYIGEIIGINEEDIKKKSFRHKNADNVVSLINSNETIKSVIFYWFENLFGKKIMKEDNEFKVTDESGTFSLSVEGDGYKSFFNLIYYLITPEFKHIIFDEPERHLHPNLQVSLFNMIKKLSVDYEKQIYLTTHNPNFIDLLSINVENILLNKKDKKAFNVTNILDGVSNKQFTTWIHYNKHILFSSAIVLLEGYSDQILLNHLIGKLNHSAYGRNTTFCSVAIAKENGGKGRIPKYQEILSQFFPSWALYDLDLLLDTSGELGKYIENESLTIFKNELTSKAITNKDELKAFFNCGSNDIDFISVILRTLLDDHKVLVLSQGEMEDYCQTLHSSDKLTDKIYDEVDHVSITEIRQVEEEYFKLLELISEVDDPHDNESKGLESLIFKMIMNFFTQFHGFESYEFSKISSDLSNQLIKDPDSNNDDKFRFNFRFIADIEFEIPKDSQVPVMKQSIRLKLEE